MEEDDIELEHEKEISRLRAKYIFIIIIVSIIVAVFSSEYTTNYLAKKYAIIPIDKVSQDAETNIKGISRSMKNIRKIIDSNYLGEIDEQKMFDEAIKGYVKGLGDEYSEYFTEEEWEDFEASALGNYVGIGIYMSTDKNDNIVVLSPIKDSPAERVGIKSGDIIAKVNDENVLGVPSDEVSNKIKGPEGTQVKITIIRENDTLEFDLTRESIKVYHVESEMKKNNIGYISLNAFDEGCAEEIKNAYNDLKSKGAKKIILDLRDNTGGLVSESLKIADYMINENEKLMFTVDANNNRQISSSQNKPIITEDIVVLVNEYSASASEILTGALKDNHRATIVGTKTFGKGVIQSVIPCDNGAHLKLTVNEYLTPNETKINKVGIEPDVKIEDNEDTKDVDEQLDKAIELLSK